MYWLWNEQAKSTKKIDENNPFLNNRQNILTNLWWQYNILTKVKLLRKTLFHHNWKLSWHKMENEVPVHSNIPDSLHKFRQSFPVFCIMVPSNIPDSLLMNTFKLNPLLQIIGHLILVLSQTFFVMLDGEKLLLAPDLSLLTNGLMAPNWNIICRRVGQNAVDTVQAQRTTIIFYRMDL